MIKENHKPLVSILMAAYNASAYLDDALQSVRRQTVVRWELLCVDDASQDDTLGILQRYASEDARIRVFHKDRNEGQAVARNEALQEAQGEIVMMLDADDWLSDDCLERVLACFYGQSQGQYVDEPSYSPERSGASDSEIDCVVLRLMEHYEEDGRESVYEIPYQTGESIPGPEAFEASLDWRLHGLYAVRRDIHMRYPYDASCHLFSDDNTTRLHYLHSRKVGFCQGTYYYRKHANSCTNSISPDRFLYMQANLSMREALLREGVSQDILDRYESHRWLNYIGQMWLYSKCSTQFTSAQRKEIEGRFRDIYHTFTGRPVPAKFGYTRFDSYRLFLLQESIYFFLRRLFRR